ncbi:30S ribosomal protein S17e [Candidatus Pacearchaeota archaeon]|nr:MAG: 30S ribosomal protein S17e [Candidatus Pacearchaeota archaeon]
MGKIRSALIKRTAKQLIKEAPDAFDTTFEANKKALGNTMPSKKMRNRIAGYITRLKKNAELTLSKD